MELISEYEFKKLQLSNFAPKNATIHSAWGTEGIFGFADGEFYRFCYFLWRPEIPREIIEVRLESFDDNVRETALSILIALKLPLRPGMGFDDVVKSCQATNAKRSDIADLSFAEFAIGDEPKYCAFCTFRNQVGLTGIIVTLASACKPRE